MFKVTDRSPLSKRERHPAGYLIVRDCTVARSGILKYSRRQIGVDGDPNEMVTVYRPPETVRAIADTYPNIPLTMTHPDENEVTPDTAKRVTVGHCGSAVKISSLANGEIGVDLDIAITDGTAIGYVDRGEYSQLSAGYGARYEHKPGITVDGTAYDYIQHLTPANHVALVEKGRCGSECRVNDQAEGDVPTFNFPCKDGQKVLDGMTPVFNLEDKSQNEIIVLNASASEL